MANEAKLGDTVTVEGHEDTWTVTGKYAQSEELKAAGLGNHSYYLRNDRTGTTLSTNERSFTSVTPRVRTR